ncbi:unnamed protein product [Ciceribacter sp. T2.26MG-112.2]|nr:unnamed protein product [Ciceribacter naphthalenivorans]
MLGGHGTPDMLCRENIQGRQSLSMPPDRLCSARRSKPLK